MRSVSNKVSKKNLSFSVPESVYDQVVIAAQSSGQSLAAWLRFAVLSYTRNWKTPKMRKESWPECGFCHRHHDEREHGV